jgi:hypothetical protein
MLCAIFCAENDIVTGANKAWGFNQKGRNKLTINLEETIISMVESIYVNSAPMAFRFDLL